MSMDPTASLAGGGPPPLRRSWWSRNWMWFVPAGCLTLVVLVAVFVGSIVLLVFGAMKSSDAYKTAVTRAKSNAQVIDALGTPIEEGLFVSGKVNVEGSTGSADLTIPISGPKGKAKIYAVATKAAGRWTYSMLEVAVDDREDRIDLLGSADRIER